MENSLNDSIGKPKQLWKAPKSLGFPSKTSVCGTTALKVKLQQVLISNQHETFSKITTLL